MAIIHPEQTLAFAIHPFRTRIKAPSDPEQFKQLLSSLKQRYGKFCYLAKRRGKQLDLVFHHSPDHLLGEMIWEALGKPSNLIYCEALPQQNQVLLVIVRNQEIYLDTRLPAHCLLAELKPLQQSKQSFDMVLHGVEQAYQLQALIKPQSFVVRDQSLLCELEASEQYQLKDAAIAQSALPSLTYAWHEMLEKVSCLALLRKIPTFL